ncbi:large subunit ribosomal protein L28 [Deinococcus metalli]|uniref:Large ribosomal subunit protein bL28 n=1 Tax=Deinococcus metalli TaxID=1141878 RepID=A0A7W8KJW9_9DEIO|nr:50S ribosomal protein L28 [Deinococcus metalli]MBB5377879.1 large subunit ribosomal protein L28 [Deinococcus metalli]GHF55322.1 50S ribosomal protein L28 [Deinococcus metalli]
MSRTCHLTGKRGLVVNRVTRRGKARADGGVGRKVTGISARRQQPNLQKKTIREHGQLRRVWLSTNALRTLARGGFPGVDLI